MNEAVLNNLYDVLKDQFTLEEIQQLIERPKYEHLGDYAFPCFSLAKKLRKSPQQIAAEIASNLKADDFQEVQVVGGYINLFLNKHQVTNKVLNSILQSGVEYGTKSTKNKNIVIDFSSPNIAKPFSMGHLRSTVIGNALANIAKKNGYKPIRINHLGDWGTQFGKLIVAYKLWGSREKIEASPIKELLTIYVKFHDEAQKNESLNEEARAAFRSLEIGDEEAISLWEWFREASLKEFKSVYELLCIDFDSFNGEAFYNDKMQPVIEELKEKQLLVKSHGAFVVEVPDMPPCLITKSDGATLYATRDLAAAMYRYQHYEPEKIFYVVGNEQSLHFKQIFKVIEKMGYDWAANLQHVPFGMMLNEGKKMSTRKGKVILLAEVIQEVLDAAKENIEEKNPTLKEKELVAQQVAIGAIIFNDLKNDRLHDIDFSIEQMLNFEGETGPYLQYTYARISSILEKAQFVPSELQFDSLGEEAWAVIQSLEQFPKVVEESYEQADPSLIAKFALKLARSFNKYYAQTRILVEDNGKEQRLALCYCVAMMIKESLNLLGIASPENM